MDVSRLNIYQRLRDFNVPSPVLDDIFTREQDLNTLEEAWHSMEVNGLNGDEIAEAVAAVIFEELDLPLDYDPEEK